MLLNWSITTEKCYYYFIAIFIVNNSWLIDIFKFLIRWINDTIEKRLKNHF